MDRQDYLSKISELEKQANASLDELGKLPHTPFKPEYVEDLESTLATAIDLANTYAKSLEGFRQLASEQFHLETLPAEPEVVVEEPAAPAQSDLQNIIAGAASLVNLWRATRR